MLLKYSHHDLKIESYFYIHQKLEAANDVTAINEGDIHREFMYIRLKGTMPLIAQNGNVIEALEELRKDVSYRYLIVSFRELALNPRSNKGIRLQIASGKIGIHFPAKNAFLFNHENNFRDICLRKLLDMYDYYEGTTIVKKGIIRPAGVVVLLNTSVVLSIFYSPRNYTHVPKFNRMP